MKNYLFAPFNDEGEQMEEFYAIRDYLPKKFRHGLIMFMARLESTYDVIISKLEADNSSFHGQYDKIQELKAEIRQLKADIKHDAKVCEDVDDEHIKEINAVKQCYEGSKMKVEELKADNVRLVEQVSSNSSNSSSTHTHTIKKEIQDYMNHHPEHKEVRLYILPIESFKDGLYDGDYICYDDGIEV